VTVQVAPKPHALEPALEVRCPRCGGKLLVYVPPVTSVSILIQTVCRRCRAIYVADLRAEGPIVSLTPDRPSA